MATQVCLITGGSRGIGLAVAQRFAAQGGRLMLAARDAGALQAAEAAVSRTGGECVSLAGDVGRPEFAEQLVAETIARFGRLDVLVNNAGVAPLANVAQMPVDVFDRMLDTNVRAVFNLTRAAWPQFLKQRQGTIVNISSVAAFDAFPGLGAYGASKAWVSAFTRSTAEEGRRDNIRVFAIAPGATETDMLRSVAPDIPADAVLSPDDVAGAILAVCDPTLRHATGQTIVVRR